MSQTLATLLADYQQMALIRRFEEEAARLYGMGLIGGFCHLSIGQVLARLTPEFPHLSASKLR